MKKVVLSMLSITSLLSLAGCTPSKDTSIDYYRDLYHSPYLEVFSDEVRLTTKAQYGYHKKHDQGYNSWFYMYGDINDKKLMDYNEDKSSWVGDNSQIQEELMVSKNVGAIRKYVSRISGKGHIYGNFKALDEASSQYTVKIYQNDKLIGSYLGKKGDTIGLYFEENITLSVGDEIYFVVTGSDAKVLFNPVITLEESQNSTIYHLNEQGHLYGDVFPYYDNDDKKLKMWYLWTDDATLNGGNNFFYTMDVSDNLLKMKNYPEGDNYDLYYEQYSEYFLQRIYDVNRFIDTSIYKYGIRDNMLYRDENRMYIIAGCYRHFDSRWDSDLMIYYSDDPMGLEWTKPGIKIATYDGYLNNNGHLPECPSLLKIGDRWYSFVSVSHVTKHQIGALQYWIGDKDKDFTEVNWENAEISFLDGEDLCAARPTHVGDKTYMWGWITASHDGVPLKPWGGYLNLPREIVQRSDGSLGGRMDPGLVEVMNYGNIYSLEEGNYDIISGSSNAFNSNSNSIDLVGVDNEISLVKQQKRNFITYNVDMKESTKVSLKVTQNNKRYLCSIEKINDEVWMKIESPDNTSHPINSKLKIRYPSKDNKYDVKIVLDEGIFEFFVNDDNALSAKTAMNNGSYDISIMSNYGSTYQNVKVNKLRSYADCEI